MRSLFWRVFASFWLAIALVAGLSWLLGHALNQDSWIISRHPGLKDLASEWVQLRESKGELASYSRLERLRRTYRIDVQVLGENGQIPVAMAAWSPPLAATLASLALLLHLEDG